MKIGTETLNRTNAVVGIAGGVLSLGFMAWQIAMTIKAVRETKKQNANSKQER